MFIMKKIYSFIRSKALIVSLSLLTTVAFSQTPVCGPIVEDFNNTGGSTAGFTGSFSLQANKLEKQNVVATGVYSITTPTYRLANIATTLGFGFILGGTKQVARVTIKVMFVSTLTNTIQIVEIGNFVPNYGISNSATICQAIDLTTLPGFPTGGAYRFQFDFVSAAGGGGNGETITFDDFRTNGILSQIPLPVTFISFEAKKIAAGVQLTWKVAGEENVARYEVERSTDGSNFTRIGTVNKSGLDTYNYDETTVVNSALYYRIKNLDNDGKYKYSSIARFINGRSEVVLKAFPQPVKGQLTIQHPVLTGNGSISISTADGRVIKSIKPATGSVQTYIDMSGLQAGLYMIRFNAGDGKSESVKIVKQ